MTTLQVFTSANTGRGMRCKNSVKRGTVVLSSEPFVNILDDKERGRRCDHCFSKREDVKRCSGCKVMRYCNRNCQREAWSQHKPECGALQRVTPTVPGRDVMLLARALWKLKSLSPNDRDTNDLVSVVDLESNYDRLSDRQKQDFEAVVCNFIVYWGSHSFPEQVPGTYESLIRFYGKMSINSFAISDDKRHKNIGIGLYVNSSLINHSCIPNCCYVFENLKMNTRTLRDIPKGEEIVISYIDLFAPSRDRQEKLESRYGFKCSCEACSGRLHDDEMLCDHDGGVLDLDSINRVKAFLEDLEKLGGSGRFEEVRRLASEYISKKSLPVKNVYMTNVHAIAMNACLELKRGKEALRYAAPVLESYRKYLPDGSPKIGFQLENFGIIMICLSKYSEALPVLEEALKIFQVTYGEESIPVQNLRQFLQLCTFSALQMRN